MKGNYAIGRDYQSILRNLFGKISVEFKPLIRKGIR